MKCTDIKKIVIDILDNETNLNKQTKFEFHNHLKTCDKCNKEFEQFKQLNDKLNHIKKIDTGEEFRNEFINKLEEEKLNLNKSYSINNIYKTSLKIAAGILLFILGSFFGYYFSQNITVKNLQSQVNYLQQSYSLSVLKGQTVSSKIKAINYFDGEIIIQPEFLSILENILNNDDNVNVRISAAKALFKYSKNKDVNVILLKSLKIQTEPMVQIELIEFLVNENNKQAIDELKILLENQNTNYIVRQYANNGLEVLL